MKRLLNLKAKLISTDSHRIPEFSQTSFRNIMPIGHDHSTTTSGQGNGAADLSAATRALAAIAEIKDKKDGPANNNPDRMAIIVDEQKTTKKEHSKESDPDAEVYSFLVEGEHDIKTLERLKESGVTFRYEVVKDGQKVMEKKIIPYDQLSLKVQELLERKLLTQVKRAYSMQALRYELMAWIIRPRDPLLIFRLCADNWGC